MTFSFIKNQKTVKYTFEGLQKLFYLLPGQAKEISRAKSIAGVHFTLTQQLMYVIFLKPLPTAMAGLRKMKSLVVYTFKIFSHSLKYLMCVF